MGQITSCGCSENHQTTLFPGRHSRESNPSDQVTKAKMCVYDMEFLNKLFEKVNSEKEIKIRQKVMHNYTASKVTLLFLHPSQHKQGLII